MAGFRLYATVLAIGLGVRFHLFTLPPKLSHLDVLASTPILVLAGVLYAIEFAADKVPWLDSFWDSFHTFIRPLGAAYLGVTAFGNANPAMQMAAGLLAGTVALTGHSTKAGARLLVNHSPEPASNILVSVAEDVLVPFGTWLSLKHPLFMLGVVAAFLVLFAWISPRIYRLLRLEVLALGGLLAAWLGGQEESDQNAGEVIEALKGKPAEGCVKVVAATGVPGLKRSVGYLCLLPGEVLFVARRWARSRTRSVPRAEIRLLEHRQRFMLDQLVMRTNGKPAVFHVFRNRRAAAGKFIACWGAGVPPKAVGAGK